MPASAKQRYLEYKAQRGACLTLFDIVHIATIAAALLAAVSQVIDMVCLQRNQAAWGALTGGEIWEIVQSAALRCYGVVFTLMVTVAELSELETCKTAACVQGLCAPVHDSFAVKHWFLRGTIYVFVGLFALESSRQYDDDTSGAAAAAAAARHLRPPRHDGIHCSGTVLMATGFLYAHGPLLVPRAQEHGQQRAKAPEGPRRPHGRGQRKRRAAWGGATAGDSAAGAKRAKRGAAGAAVGTQQQRRRRRRRRRRQQQQQQRWGWRRSGGGRRASAI